MTRKRSPKKPPVKRFEYHITNEAIRSLLGSAIKRYVVHAHYFDAFGKRKASRGSVDAQSPRQAAEYAAEQVSGMTPGKIERTPGEKHIYTVWELSVGKGLTGAIGTFRVTPVESKKPSKKED